MDLAGWTALTVAVCAGTAQIIVAVATLIRQLRTEAMVRDVGRTLNGRLDLLLSERELRLRAEHAAELERIRTAALAGLAQPSRPEGLIRPQTPEGGPSGEVR